VGYKAKLVLPPNRIEEDTLNFYSLAVVTPQGEELTRRLPLKEYLQIVAASNFKQRARMAMLYHHAELRNYAVAGTANRDEQQQGFFVKYGDSAADIRPIAHLYKTQVYQLAMFLDVPEEVRRRPPTSDTYAAPQTQQEFFFRLPFETLDLISYARDHAIPVNEVSSAIGFSSEQVERIYRDLDRRAQTTAYLHMPPVELNWHQDCMEDRVKT